MISILALGKPRNFGVSLVKKRKGRSEQKYNRDRRERVKEKKGLSASLSLFGFAKSPNFPKPSLTHVKKMEILILI